MNKPSLQKLADSLCAAFPKLDHAQRRLALATYRRLLRGTVASPLEIAQDAGIETEKARRVLADWIARGAVFGGRVIPVTVRACDGGAVDSAMGILLVVVH